MGHEIRTASYDIKTKKSIIQGECNLVAIHEDYMEGCSGVDDIIFEENKVFNNYDDAYAYLDKKTNANDYYCGAVIYLEYPRLEKTKYHQELEKRLQEWSKKHTKLSNKIHYKDVKSKFISCPQCESKIATKFIKGNYCPVCYAEMRPKTTLDTIARYEEIISNLKKEINTEERKLQEKNKSKAIKKWLVRFEFHS